MALTTKKKQEIIDKFKRHENDTGSPEVQIALISERIKKITEHLKKHGKDYHTKKGLEILSSKRKRLLKYLRRNEFDRFKKIKDELSLRV